MRLASISALVGAALIGMPAPCTKAGEAPTIVFAGELASDYIYRGITLSAHRPSVSAGVELQQNWFYVALDASSVRLPTTPAAEIVTAAGIRPQLVRNLDIDIGIRRLFYPGSTPVDASGSGDYTEAAASISAKLWQTARFGGKIAYAPNYANTAAYSFLMSANSKIALPKYRWAGLTPYLSGEIGYVRFGSVSSALGGYALPNYTYLNVGLGFERKPFTLEFDFSATTLSRENCYVQTGDLSASPGGAMTAANPLGLRSSWCGPAFIAKLSAEISSDKLR